MIITRLLEAHNFIRERDARFRQDGSDLGDDGTNDMLVSNVLRTNELQIWFVSEHLVEMPLTRSK